MPISDRVSDALKLAQALQAAAPRQWVPPAEGQLATSEMVVYRAVVSGTNRAYIDKIVNQINGAYERGWYDCCAVMIRRLLETLIIEVFEANGIAGNIKKGGEFMFLRELINATLSETAWNLGRSTKQALPKLKDIGDKSAHSRRFIAVRNDIDDIKADLRTVVQELLILSGLK